MPFSYQLGRVRTSAATSPITFTYTVNPGDAAIGLLLKTAAATDRAGGAPTLGSTTFQQAATTQKAAASPESGCEGWYALNPNPGTYTVTIPNTGSLTIFVTVVLARGGTASLDGAIGANATAANPSPGAVTVTQGGGIGFAITAGGWQTWAPSAQVGTLILNTDDGAHGGGEQYILNPPVGSHTLSWTFGTSDDWGAVAMYFKEVPPNRLENYHNPKCVSAGVISVGSIG